MSYKTTSNCLKASTVALLMLFFQPLVAQKNFNGLTQQLTEQQKNFGNDFAVLLATPDTIVYQKEFGAMKVKTVAPIASASKWLTAALVLQFVDEGKLSLDDKVAKYLPVFEKYGKNYITIRHCLSHLTGIKSEGSILERLRERRKYNTLDEEVAAFAAHEIKTNPGTAFEYNEIGLNIAARVLEVVSKKRFDMLIKQKLFNPLGMRQTTFTATDGSAPNPSGGARSTAMDYMAFLKMLLNNGKHNGQQILSEASIAELRKIQTANLPMNDAPKAAAGFQYALGAWVLESNGGMATVLASPGLFGTWPAVDFCRKYAFLFFTKDLLGEQKRGVYEDLKKLTDTNFPNGCK